MASLTTGTRFPFVLKRWNRPEGTRKEYTRPGNFSKVALWCASVYTVQEILKSNLPGQLVLSSQGQAGASLHIFCIRGVANKLGVSSGVKDFEDQARQ